MVVYMKLLSIVIAVSLDGFGVGMTYGMRKIRIPFSALFIIMCCSGFIVLTSMTIGHLIKGVIAPSITGMIGSFILIGLGIFVLCSIAKPYHILNRKIQKSTTSSQANVGQLKKILHDPTKADKDSSGIISATEAFVLGTALALDAFAAGFGASMLGYTPLLTALLIAVMSGLFLYLGIKLGLILAKSRTVTKITYAPPLLLIAIGIYHLF